MYLTLSEMFGFGAQKWKTTKGFFKRNEDPRHGLEGKGSNRATVDMYESQCKLYDEYLSKAKECRTGMVRSNNVVVVVPIIITPVVVAV